MLNCGKEIIGLRGSLSVFIFYLFNSYYEMLLANCTFVFPSLVLR